MLRLITAFLVFVDFKALLPAFAPEDADELKRLWLADDVPGLLRLLVDIGDAEEPLERVPKPDGMVTIAAMLDHGQERVARFYDQMIQEAAQSLGVELDGTRFPGNPRSWADLLAFMRATTGTPRLQRCGAAPNDDGSCHGCGFTWTKDGFGGCANEVQVPEDGA